MSENRREYFRVFFDQTISGKISIRGGDSLPIDIHNMSAGGLIFISTIHLPINEKVECSFNIFESSFLLDGSIVRKSTKRDYVEYGVRFTVNQDTSSQLFKQLNYYQMRQRKGFEE